jgi:hypothetical protein
MTTVKTLVCVILLLGWGLPVLAQQSATTVTDVAVLPLVNFSGTLMDVNGQAAERRGKDQEGRAPRPMSRLQWALREISTAM